MTAILLHPRGRALENGRSSPVGAAIVAGAALLRSLPVAAVVATHDLTCGVTGFTQRGDSDCALVGVLALVFMAGLGPLALAAGEPQAWRLTGLTSGGWSSRHGRVVLSFAALNLYCDGSPGVLYALSGWRSPSPSSSSAGRRHSEAETTP